MNHRRRAIIIATGLLHDWPIVGILLEIGRFVYITGFLDNRVVVDDSSICGGDGTPGLCVKMIAKTTAGLFPFALRAPELTMIHAVNLTALLRLAAHAPGRAVHLRQRDCDQVYAVRLSIVIALVIDVILMMVVA